MRGADGPCPGLPRDPFDSRGCGPRGENEAVDSHSEGFASAEGWVAVAPFVLDADRSVPAATVGVIQWAGTRRISAESAPGGRRGCCGEAHPSTSLNPWGGSPGGIARPGSLSGYSATQARLCSMGTRRKGKACNLRTGRGVRVAEGVAWAHGSVSERGRSARLGPDFEKSRSNRRNDFSAPGGAGSKTRVLDAARLGRKEALPGGRPT